MKHIKEKYQGEIREEKAIKGCNNTYKSLCFAIFTTMGLYVVPQMSFAPFQLLGTGSSLTTYDTYPINPRPFFFTAYYLIELGYHFEGLIYHAI